MTMRIVLAGGAHLDRVARSNGAFESRASNPGSCREAIGGASFNAARALARLGARPHLVSARGGDAVASAVASALEAEGITDGSLTWLDRRSASYTAILDETGELRAAIADMDIYDLLTPRAFRRAHLREMFTGADAWLLDANLPPPTLEELTSSAGGKPVFAIAVSPAKVVRLRNCLPALAALFLSRAEAASLAKAPSDSSPCDLARHLSEAGLRRAVVTDGPRPAAILDGGAIHLQAPPLVESVRDVTGAGDTLAAVAMLEHLAGADFLAAVRAGMAASSLHIQSELPKDALPLCRSLASALPPPTSIA